MVLKLLVFMVAVAVLEGVAGLQEEQFANETQIEANPDHTKRGRRLSKLPCQMMEGICQAKDEPCDGIVRRGPLWCLHDRHFECCYPKDCELNGCVYPNGAVAVQNCIELECENGCWRNKGLSSLCCPCHTYGATTIVPYEIPRYSMTGHDGLYKFSWYMGGTINPDFGINIFLVENGSCISEASYCENGVTVTIYFNPLFPGYPTVSVSSMSDFVHFSQDPEGCVHQLPLFIPAVHTSCDKSNIYIIGNYGISLHVSWSQNKPWCAKNVYSYAAPSVYGDLNGLCENVLNDCQPRPVTILPNINAFIEDWKRSFRTSQRRKNQPIIESSMSEIEKSCEELNNGPCKIPSSEECKKLKEDCVSRIRNAIKPGQGSFSDSTE